MNNNIPANDTLAYTFVKNDIRSTIFLYSPFAFRYNKTAFKFLDFKKIIISYPSNELGSKYRHAGPLQRNECSPVTVTKPKSHENSLVFWQRLRSVDSSLPQYRKAW